MIDLGRLGINAQKARRPSLYGLAGQWGIATEFRSSPARWISPVVQHAEVRGKLQPTAHNPRGRGPTPMGLRPRKKGRRKRMANRTTIFLELEQEAIKNSQYNNGCHVVYIYRTDDDMFAIGRRRHGEHRHKQCVAEYLKGKATYCHVDRIHQSEPR